jgi:uncharacterized repeat protein (TIGR03803 family)
MSDIRIRGPFSVAAMAAVALTVLAPSTSQAQKFSVLYAFGPAPDAQSPRGALAQGQDGNLYGTSLHGGSSGQGAAFLLTPAGKEAVLGSFTASSGGINCNTGLFAGSDGNFYGACPNGQSPYNFGTVFNIGSSGVPDMLYAFSGTDGQNPETGAPVEAANGSYYGVTEQGGTNNGGTAYVIAPGAKLATLYNFGASSTDANTPSGPLIQGSDGNFYGTTSAGGTLGGGTVFRMTGTGQVTVLHSFPTNSKKDGAYPMGGVVQANNGNFYGVTNAGGANNLGTVYVLTGAGKSNILHSFSIADQASSPCDTLAMATDRNFYGTAASCTNGSCGTSIVFEVTAKGAFTVLHTFNPATDGTNVSGPLMLHTDGTFYGAAEEGGGGGGGTIYSLNVGLAPFVSVSPAFGPVGAAIGIYGQGFDAKTKVYFAGTLAKFSLVTPNYGVAAVPQGAVTGYLTVKASSLKMKSLQLFTVTSSAASRHASGKSPRLRLRADNAHTTVR